jgi:hypothetical protein
MIRLVLALLLAVTATIAVGYAVAQANEAYDANGRLVVRSIQHGNSASSYSPDGRLLHAGAVKLPGLFEVSLPALSKARCSAGYGTGELSASVPSALRLASSPIL